MPSSHPPTPDEATRRGLEALADGLRRRNPGAIVEILSNEDDPPDTDRDDSDRGEKEATNDQQGTS